VPRFIKLKGNDTCTDSTCHKIAAAPDPAKRAPGMGGGSFRGPYERWIRRVTGEAHPRATAAGQAESVVYWMPDGTKWTKAKWEAAYKLPGGSGKTVVDLLIECGTAVGEGKPLPANCEEYHPKPSCPVAEKADGSCPVLVCPVPTKPDGTCPVPIR
jgi:hypothetical protein